MAESGALSEAGVGLCEVGQFVWRTDATEHGVPMREATETRNHLPMLPSIIEKTGVAITLIRRNAVAQCLEQRDGTLLQCAVLGVLQWHVGEHTLDRWQLAVETFLDTPQRQLLCEKVLRPSARIVAIEIARKLVQYDQQGQPSRWRC